MQNNLNTTNIGNIDECGFLNNLKRKGFTTTKCLGELHANAIDACAEHIDYNISRNNIKIIDDGLGMTIEQIRNGFSIYRPNHNNDRSIGVSGIGMKGALYNLSINKLTKIITKTESGEYLTVEAPWDEIYQNKKYSNMIRLRGSNVEEITQFNYERVSYNIIRGTTIILPYSDILSDAIKLQFQTPVESDDFKPLDQFSVIFGGFSQIVSYQHYEQSDGSSKVLQPYNYFDAFQSEFYLGKDIQTIEFYENGNNEYRFIWRNVDGEIYEIPKAGRGYSKEIRCITTGLFGWNCIGEAKVITGARINHELFDENNPQMPTAKTITHPYDKIHIGDKNSKFSRDIQVVRNKQLIGIVEVPEISPGSERGNGESMFSSEIVHCQIQYNPLSNQENKQDLIIGVQENKNQFKSNMPLSLTRLIKAIKYEHCKNIWNYFTARCQSFAYNIGDELPPLVVIDNSIHNDVIQDELELPPLVVIDNSIQNDVIQDELELPPLVIIDNSIQNDVIQDESQPIDVPGYRRCAVYGHELISELQRIITSIDHNINYTSAEHIRLFNLLNNFH